MSPAHVRWSVRSAALALFVARAASATPVEPRTFDLTRISAADTYTAARGYGFDLGTYPSAGAPQPFYFSIAEPESNYRVTVTFGDAQASSEETLMAESRQLLLEHLTTPPGVFVTRSFIVNIRTPNI